MHFETNETSSGRRFGAGRYLLSRKSLSGFRYLFPGFGPVKINGREILKHFRLIPYDVLVILFIGQIMMPIWAAAILVAVNIGTWWCYHRIPQFLRRVSDAQGEGILISAPIVEDFARFINSCGIHHRAHYGLMFAMMGGFHAAMTGHLWSLSFPPGYALTLAWMSYGALVVVDFTMYWVSLRTLQEMRFEKLQEANEYTDELKRSNKELEQFAYIASHDLRAPLRGIINLSNWIEEDVRDRCSPETLRNLKLLNSRTQRMDHLLNDLLQYSRIGRDEMETEQISLRALSADIFDSFNANGRFSIHLPGEETNVTDYRITFELLISNLIGNAIKHATRPDGNVWVDFRTSRTHLTIVVEDDGPGIAEEFREQIFQIFTTLERRDVKEASGMGLAIVKKIVHHKAGDIFVDNSEHGGVRFTITIPLQRLDLIHG